MRTLLKITVPVAKGNHAIADGSLQRVLQQTLEAVKPEATYFVVSNGQRGAYIFFDLTDVSQIPVIAEPLFQALEAEVEFLPALNQEDLMTGLGALGGSTAS